MFNSKMIKEAHKLTKEIKVEFPEVNYNFQFGLCISYLLKGAKMEEVKMVEITQGSEKQIAWANQIRNTSIKNMEKEANHYKEREIRENWDYSVIIGKIEKGIIELKTTVKDAKFWIEHKNLDGVYLQKIKKQK